LAENRPDYAAGYNPVCDSKKERQLDNGCSSCSSGGCSSGHSAHSAEDAARHREIDDQLQIVSRLEKVKHTVIVLSGKGGVGKSTVAVNLACALADSGFKTGLLDIDIHGPSVPRMMGMADAPIHAEKETIYPVETIWGLKMMSIAFFLKQTEAVIWRGPLKMGVIKQFLRDVEWGELDYLVVDCPPGTGDEPLSIVQLLGKPSGAVLVTTPQEVALDAVKRSVAFCTQVRMPILGVVENMAGFACPKCGEVTELFGSGGGAALAAAAECELLASIPLSRDLMSSGDLGRPPALLQDSATGKLFRDAAARINAKLTT
jgi:Mrp family chromosome partitioning ATPase